ncbi:hypothetical protein RvY_09237 [Ramazzottius varieornatus]|uniref:Uncharacterized protein n=1 Tax=Ramazzottius varieornatus TaxID=947166 RepID=A0A1D1V8R0_RAMVA|nr:hypothetical protein RvY_09237 [Ramazzottius varieornatus]
MIVNSCTKFTPFSSEKRLNEISQIRTESITRGCSVTDGYTGIHEGIIGMRIILPRTLIDREGEKLTGSGN